MLYCCVPKTVFEGSKLRPDGFGFVNPDENEQRKCNRRNRPISLLTYFHTKTNE